MPSSSRPFFFRHFACLSAILIIGASIFFPEAWAVPRFKVLYSFAGGNDGTYPNGALLSDISGHLFGTTYFGGTGGCTSFNGNGCGTVFELQRDTNGKWTHIVLYNFQGGNDGAGPNGGLVLDTAGNLFGTTDMGGTQNIGTVFELSPGSGGWSESILHAFGGRGDGAKPMAGLIMDGAGNLYGTAAGGGAYDGGAVFEVSPGSSGWTESVIYSLCPGNNCSSGLTILARVALDSHGDLFGVTEFGGSGPYGTVFEVRPRKGGWRGKTIHSFTGPDGGHPDSAGVIFDKAGSFYGTTAADGAFGNGTVYRFSPQKGGRWAEAILYNFRSGSSEGSLNSGLAMDATGNLFGANGTGGSGSCNGSSGCGMVYEITPRNHRKSTYRALHTFTGGADGGLPSGDPILDQSGTIYGNAGMGGNLGNGVVYSVIP